MTTNKVIEWTMAKSGKHVEIKISVTREMSANGTVNLDGDRIQVPGTSLQESQTVTAYLDGVELESAYIGHIQHIRPQMVSGLEVVAVIRSKVALTKERCEAVETAIREATAEAETDPAVMEYRKAEAKRAAGVARAEKHIADVEDMMTLGGHTY